MAETTLEWKLESINFDELKLTLTESMQERIGDNASGSGECGNAR